MCIDQSSTDERSEQVTRMSSIYKLATRVVVWLGLSGPYGQGPLGEKRILSRFNNDGRNSEVSRDSILYPHPANKQWMGGFMGAA